MLKNYFKNLTTLTCGLGQLRRTAVARVKWPSGECWAAASFAEAKCLATVQYSAHKRARIMAWLSSFLGMVGLTTGLNF